MLKVTVKAAVIYNFSSYLINISVLFDGLVASKYAEAAMSSSCFGVSRDVQTSFTELLWNRKKIINIKSLRQKVEL